MFKKLFNYLKLNKVIDPINYRTYSKQGICNEEIQLQLGKDLTYLDDWTIKVKDKSDKDMYQYYSVYHNPNPDRIRNHKDYLLVRPDYCPVTGKSLGKITFTGLDREEILQSSKYLAIKCLKTDTIIVSRFNHDFQTSPITNDVYIDGANICPRYCIPDKDKINHCLGYYNFITREFKLK